jgi:multidrug resistance efflux pump
MLELERENLEMALAQASSADLGAAEIRLSEAQAAFLVTETLSDRTIDSQDRSYMDDFIDTLLDAAEAELEDAQQEYDALLTQDAAEDVLEARARLAVAIERYETALDQRNQLLTGDRSLSVRAAEAAVRQAEAVVREAEAQLRQVRAHVALAEKAVAQAQAALDTLQVQLDKLTVKSAVSGVIMTRSIEPGEMILPGVTALTIGQMSSMTITVYLPEDRYGEIDLGQSAQVSVDSFPGTVFEAVVTRISDQAEYTPRNVQTEEDRRTTVYAVELSVEDAQGKLKPGMPADVVFGG